jgi:hypothetical protein
MTPTEQPNAPDPDIDRSRLTALPPCSCTLLGYTSRTVQGQTLWRLAHKPECRLGEHVDAQLSRSDAAGRNAARARPVPLPPIGRMPR